MAPAPIAPKRQQVPGSRITYVPLAQTKEGRKRAVLAAYKAQKSTAPRSLLGQVKDTATGIIPGVIHAGVEAGQSAAAPFRAGVDILRGKTDPFAALQLGTGGGAMQAELTQALAHPNDRGGLVEKYEPLQLHMAQSGQRTGGRLIHPSRYGKAIREGHIVDALLEDVTNASIVAGPLAKGLAAGAEAAEGAGAARAATVLRGAEKGATLVHTVGQRINDAPFSLARSGLRGAREGLVSTLGSVAELERGVPLPPGASLPMRVADRVLSPLAGAAERLRDVAPLRLRDEGIGMRQTIREASTAAPRAASRAARDLYRDAGITTLEDAGRTAEQGAAVALMNGVGQVDELARGAVSQLPAGVMPSAEQVRQMHTLRDMPEQTYTPDVAEVVRKYQAGTLDPAAMDRIHAYQDAVSKQMDAVTDRALSGTGRIKGTLDPAQLGDEALDAYVLPALKDVVPKHLVDIVERARALKIPWDDLERAIPELTPLLDNPQMYPKAWRPAMRAAALTREGFASNPALGSKIPMDAVPLRPQQLLDAGVERPRYFSSADSDIARPKRVRLGRERVNEGTTGVRGVTSENQSLVSEVQPYSARTMAEALGREAAQTAYNEKFLAGVERTGLPKVKDFLPTDVLDDIKNTADAEVAAQRLGKGTAEARAIHGRLLVDELEQRGYSVIEGDLDNPHAGDFNPDSGMRYDRIGHDAVILPTAVKEKLVQYWAQKGGGVPAQVLDWINKKFKSNVLPFSIRWQLGDMVGGAFMAWVGGGMNPVELARGMQDAKHLSPAASEEILNHPDWADASLSQGDRQLMQTGPDAPRPKTPIGKFKEASFKFNNAINRVNRNGYLVARVNSLLEERGLTMESVDAAGAWKDADVQAAVKAAVDDASKVMGTFDEMSPFEQRYMKRIFPFWAWNRHITSLAFRTAIDNPARIAWTMRLGSMGTNPDDEMPEYMKGALGIGGQLVPTNFINPFNDVGGGDPIYTPQGALKSMSPGIKLGISAVTGLDANKGLAPISQRGGSLQRGLTPFYGLRHPAALAYQAAQSFPPARVGISIAPEVNVAGVELGPHPRYGNGQMIRVGSKASGAPIDTTSRLKSAAGLIGLPAPTSKEDAANMVAGAPKSSSSSVLHRVKLGKAKTHKAKLR